MKSHLLLITAHAGGKIRITQYDSELTPKPPQCFQTLEDALRWLRQLLIITQPEQTK